MPELPEVETIEPAAVLTIHLRMSGRLYLVPRTEPATGYERVTLRLDDDRELRFYDPRKFGRMTIGPEPAPGVAHLGPEPLEDGFTPAAFADELQRRRRMIKPLLLDQGVVAGLGNGPTGSCRNGPRCCTPRCARYWSGDCATTARALETAR